MSASIAKQNQQSSVKITSFFRGSEKTVFWKVVEKTDK